MTFLAFENKCSSAEALITAMVYDEKKSLYELTIFGLGSDGFSYTEAGKVWLDKEDFNELIASEELEFPHELIGRRIKLVAINDIEPEL